MDIPREILEELDRYVDSAIDAVVADETDDASISVGFNRDGEPLILILVGEAGMKKITLNEYINYTFSCNNEEDFNEHVALNIKVLEMFINAIKDLKYPIKEYF